MILDELVARSHERVAAAHALVPLEALRERADSAPPIGTSFADALRTRGVSLIAEIKRASPSRGTLNGSLEPGEQACLYARAGADAISVLTEPSRFLGSLADLAGAREALSAVNLFTPLLRKDFIVDTYQVFEARLAGAAAVLLIAAALEPAQLRKLYDQALALGLTPLIEVHDESEARAVAGLSPVAVGINNRDLRTFHVDTETTARLRPLLPAESLAVAESGIHSAEQMRRLAGIGIDAALVGEALVTAPDASAAVRALKEAGR